MERNRLVLAVATLIALLGTYGTATAQYIFMDADGDGLSTSADKLAATGATKVDIWLETNQAKDGSLVAAPLAAGPLSIFSYEIAVAAVGGTVKWGDYTNLQPSMSFPFGRAESSTEFYIGFGGTTPLPPGKYHLGTLGVQVVSGDPQLEFRAHSGVRHLGGTSFGSMNLGVDGDHTLKYTQDRSYLTSRPSGESGDWADAAGLRSAVSGGGEASGEPKALTFGVQVRGSGGPGSGLQFAVTTTRSGYLRVRLFDLQGRLVGTLADKRGVAPGTHALDLTGTSLDRRSLAAGIYFYRVDTSEAVRTGKIAIVK